MKTHSSFVLLAALGVLSLAGPAAAAVDTSEWKCEKCPYPKGTSGTVDVGVGAVSDAAARFGDWTGLQRQGAHVVLGGTLTHRSGDGYYADVNAADLGLGSRSIEAQSGREGRYALRLGYQEIPRWFGDAMVSPFGGIGSAQLSLPTGYPRPSTATMGSLAPVDPSVKWKRFELGGTHILDGGWSWRVSLRRDVRDGTRPLSSSFFSTAAQLLAPVDHVTDQLEVSASYNTVQLQATLAYLISRFENDASSLSWANPFQPVVAGANRGQLALAPNNTLHQLSGSAGYAVSPTIRVSGDFAVGRLTQDAAFVPPTANSTLLLPAGLPATLDGRVDTFNGGLRISAAPIAGLRLNASWAHDVRDNRTGVRNWPQVTTDLYLNPGTTANTPFDTWHDRFKASADWRAGGALKLKLAGGFDYDVRERNYTEVVKVREATVWASASVQPVQSLSIAAKLQRAERDNTPYGTATWFGAAENPLLRKFNIASRTRDGGTLRADFTASEKLSIGLTAGTTNDDYDETAIGLQSSRSESLGVDVSFALSEETQFNAFAQGERVRTRQAGSQTFSVPEWSALHRDRFEIAGIGFKHVITADKFDIGGEALFGRSTTAIEIDTLLPEAPFPANKTRMDSLRLWANYKIDDKMSIKATYANENYRAEDWHVDGILPATVGNLLSLGEPAPRYRVHLVTVALRYRF